MNILGLVFSLLLILSYGFYATWDKQLGSTKLRSSYLGHERANRKILNRYQSEIYAKLGSVPTVKAEPQEIKRKNKASKPATPLNRHCSKLNLWPLLQEGKEAHPYLYEMAAQLIRTFYTPLAKNKKQFEHQLLHALISKSAITQDPLTLEKIDLKDKKLQRLYYKMLKGTKKGYPPLLDYVKADPTKDKICICHANPTMLRALFKAPIADKLYREIHQQNAPLLTQEMVERIYNEMHETPPPPELFTTIELGYPHHAEHQKTFLAEDSHTNVFLRKTLKI